MALTPAYFRGLVEEETKRLTSMCHYWESVIASQPDISDEAQGYIRSATGHAKLLMNERFSQFSGLIHVCENKLGEKKTTCEDLQGFWDMVYFQVDDVIRKFDQLSKMQENAWQLDETADTKKVKTTKPAATKCVLKDVQKARSAASRKRLAEAKARMAIAVSTQTPAATADKENSVIFEGPHSFIASTPAQPRQNKTRCPQGTPRSLRETPKQNFSPHARITRSAKKALLQHN